MSPEPAPPPDPATGPDDLARQVLARFRRGASPAAVRPAGTEDGGRRPRRPSRRYSPGEPLLSGARPDERDPQRLGASVAALMHSRGWESTLAVAAVMGRWEEIVGRDIAAHCRPERITEGVLHLVAESTAWATQLRLLSRTITERLGAEVGRGVVTAVRVHGPVTPDWRHGPRRVTGRGPRDTYG